MTLLPPTKVHRAFGYIDMRKGMDGLALLPGRTPSRVTCSYWRRCRANLIKIVYWDGMGLCLFTKRSNRASSYGRRV